MSKIAQGGRTNREANKLSLLLLSSEQGSSRGQPLASHDLQLSCSGERERAKDIRERSMRRILTNTALPQSAGIDLDSDLLEEIAQHPNICGAKVRAPLSIVSTCLN